jgi:hypothetical protein
MPVLKPNAGAQTFALQQPYSIKEILYGGARGGGKTFAGLIWLSEYVHHPRFKGLVIRRNSDDLSDWIDRARHTFSGLGATVTGNPAVIRFPSGASIRTGHLRDDTTYTKYQGHEYQKILIEELTQIQTEERYLKLISSCRTSIPELRPQIFCTANPGGVGHLWVKRRFVDPAPPNKRFTGQDGMSRIYVPATIDDNPILTTADPDYIKSIEALKYTDASLYKAWRFGVWDIFVGQVFKEWQPYKDGQPYHVIPSLPTYIDPDDGQYHSILDKCQKYIALDWGYNDPTSIHWIAVTPEDDTGVRHYYIYREVSGTEHTPSYWAEQIAEIAITEPVESLIMPHDAYSNLGGSRPIEQQFREVFDRYSIQYPNFHISMVSGEAKSHKAKINRQALLHDLLAESNDGLPFVQVVETCRKLIETLPALPYSDTKPEEIDEKSDDHYYDSATYGLFKILGGKAFVPLSEQVQHKKDSFMIDSDGNTHGLHVDMGRAIRESEQGDQDWRYM